MCDFFLWRDIELTWVAYRHISVYTRANEELDPPCVSDFFFLYSSSAPVWLHILISKLNFLLLNVLLFLVARREPHLHLTKVCLKRMFDLANRSDRLFVRRGKFQHVFRVGMQLPPPPPHYRPLFTLWAFASMFMRKWWADVGDRGKSHVVAFDAPQDMRCVAIPESMLSSGKASQSRVLAVGKGLTRSEQYEISALNFWQLLHTSELTFSPLSTGLKNMVSELKTQVGSILPASDSAYLPVCMFH